jgi:hypothetical protein
MGVTEGFAIYQTQPARPIQARPPRLQMSSVRQCVICVTRWGEKRSQSSAVHVWAATVPHAHGAGGSAFA